MSGCELELLCKWHQMGLVILGKPIVEGCLEVPEMRNWNKDCVSIGEVFFGHLSG